MADGLGEYFKNVNLIHTPSDVEREVTAKFEALSGRIKDRSDSQKGMVYVEPVFYEDGRKVFKVLGYDGNFLAVDFEDIDTAMRVLKLTFDTLGKYYEDTLKGKIIVNKSSDGNVLLSDNIAFLDYSFLSDKDFRQAFGDMANNNDVKEAYAKFLDTINPLYTKGVDKSKQIPKSQYVERLVPDGNGGYFSQVIPPKPESKTPTSPQLPQPPKPGQTRIALGN